MWEVKFCFVQQHYKLRIFRHDAFSGNSLVQILQHPPNTFKANQLFSLILGSHMNDIV